MKISESAKNWIIAIALIIFAGIASGAWLWLSSQDSGSDGSASEISAPDPEPVVIQFKDYVLGSDLLQIEAISNIDGTEIPQGLVILGAFLLIAIFVVGLGVMFTLITWFTSRQVTAVEADEGYQASLQELNDREKQRMDGWRDSQPIGDAAAPEMRARSSWFATSLLIILLVWIIGLILSVTLLADITWELFGLEVSAALLVNLLLVLAAAAVLFFIARSRIPAELDSGATDYQPMNWGTIWILMTGLIIFGLGTGLAIAMRSGG